MQVRTPAPPAEASPYSAHIPALDGIRGLAVIAVMSSHLFPGTARSPLTRAIQTLFLYGATGVDLFFVLSGFLITGILVDSLSDPHFFRKFYARRVLRIFPLYYGVLGMYALASLLFGLHYSGQLWSMLLYLQNTHFIARAIYDYNGPSPLPLSHFWSLAIEEQFYLVWPFVVFFVRRRRTLLWVCLAAFVCCPLARAALWLHGWPYYPVHNSTLLRADSLLTGAAFALLLRSRLHDVTLRFAPAILGAGTVLLALVFLLPSWFTHLWPRLPWAALAFRYTGFDLVYVALLALALRPNLVQRVCRAPFLQSLGRYSYGLYVLHLPLFSYLETPLHTAFQRHLTTSKGAVVALTGLVCFALSYGAAYLSFRFYERPFLKLKRFFSYRTAPSRQMQAPLN